MTLGKWESVIDPEMHDIIKANVHEAITLGKEDYGQIVLEASETLMRSDAFQYLAQVLVIGNIAFDAKPEMEIGQDDYKVHVRIDAK